MYKENFILNKQYFENYQKEKNAMKNNNEHYLMLMNNKYYNLKKVMKTATIFDT